MRRRRRSLELAGRGRPIADLDRVDWCECAAVIVPDSDVWTRPDLLQPVFALGKELEGSGPRWSRSTVHGELFNDEWAAPRPTAGCPMPDVAG